ncbi:MAG: DNA-protecting protein DprA [Acidobacteria bacterium]|nr:DNA-protecting protein DprA [Acidobacteriota bacterium]
MDLLDAVVLTELLRSPASRRILRPRRPAGDAGDQRALPAPDELWQRVRTEHSALGDELAAARRRADRLLRVAAERGIRALPFGAEDYPAPLAAIPDPPPVLWYRGAAQILDAPAVAIVGSRTGSQYAREVAFQLASGLAACGIAVASGLARGVDAAAHRGALEAGGPTIAVPGCGVDVIYPPEHGELLRDVVSAGAVAGELPPGEPPRAFHFPRRNRLISGLSLAVVVVEASERSGSLITARCAAEQGREVMAVPGSVLAGRSRGGHALIRDGARIVESVDDILDEIRPQARSRQGASESRAEPERDELLGRMDRGETYDLDELAALTQLDPATLASRVVELELEGRLARSDSGRFSRS